MIAAGAIPAADIRVGSQQALAVYAGEELVWEAETADPSCLTFSSPAAFTLAVENATKNWDGTLDYSTDRTTWEEWDGTTTLMSGANNKLYLRGINNTYLGPSVSSSNRRLVITGANVSCAGNIETLLDYEVVLGGGHPTMGDHSFYALFYGCTALVSAPELKAITLSRMCYGEMFYGCTNLRVPPQLPATTLAPQCYTYMFRDCTALTDAPALPAETLALGCYSHMFEGCTSLVQLPKLSALWLPWTCYSRMFGGCGKIKLSQVQTDEYVYPYRIPTRGTGSGDDVGRAMGAMFSGTGGTFATTPSINTTYYTSNEIVEQEGD